MKKRSPAHKIAGAGLREENLINLLGQRRCDPPLPLLLLCDPPPPLDRGAGADRSRTIGGLIRTDCGVDRLALELPVELGAELELNLCQPPLFA